MIRGIVLGATSAIAFIASASAADMYRAPAGGGLKDGPYVPAATWTGFYVGVNGGYGWSADSRDLAFVGSDAGGEDAQDVIGKRSLDPTGGFGGGQIGYNWQGGIHPNLVFGIEADIQGAGIKDSASQRVTNDAGAVYSGAAKSELDWFGTVRGRLGYSFDRALIYFTGGLAYGSVKDQLTLTATDGSSTDTKRISKDGTNTGYVLGGGLEYQLSQVWSLKGEYQYLHLSGDKISGVASADGGEDTTTGSLRGDHNYHTVRVGLNYHITPGYEPLK